MANPQHITWLLEGVTAWNARREQIDFWPDFDSANIPAILQGSSYKHSEIHLGTSLEGINLRNALIRNANLSGLNLAKPDLQDAKLQGSSFASADLRGATLALANFSEVILLVAKLNGAKAGGADFSGANLSGAHLDDGIFSQADFTGANLVSAHVANADLKGASLAEANLTCTELWKASLYKGSGLDATMSSQLVGEVASVGELTTIVDLVVRSCDSSNANADSEMPILYFRGEALDTWKLRPSSTRPPSDEQPDVRGREGEMLLDLMSRRPEEFSHLRSALSEWVLAQHYGLKTRLLDVTRNPLVALFSVCDDSAHQRSFTDEDGVLHVFAVPRKLVKPFDSDSVSVITNFAKLPLAEQLLLLGKREQTIREEMQMLGRKAPIGIYSMYYSALTRLYHNIGREKPHFKERIDPRDLYKVFVVEPEQYLERVRAQSAAFLVSAFHQRFEPSHVLAWNRDIPIYGHHKFRIPAKAKLNLLRELQLLGVTRESLFPGLEEAAQAVMRQHGR